MAEVILVVMMMMTVTIIMVTVVGAKAASETKDISLVRPDLHMKFTIRGKIVKRTHSVVSRSV
jgi:hypothetical protein